ncbi:hypothetical protein [Natrinema marinum]|nr:hypothetical protein [Natrinema marinum]
MVVVDPQIPSWRRLERGSADERTAPPTATGALEATGREATVFRGSER